MATSVIQLSDLHFGAGKQNLHPSHRLMEHVADVARELDNPVILASGDITFRALDAGYEEAAQFFERLLELTGVDRKRFLFCPGNHDCHSDTGFGSFDAFTYRIRRDDECTFSKANCRTLRLDGLTFVLLNSVHHLDHRFGLVDISALCAAAVDDPASCIAVSHHHLIPSEEHDASTTRNAYDVLSTLDDRSIPVLLHGHQHVMKGIPIGRTPVHVFGVNSFNFSHSGGQNAIGVLEWRDDRVTFTRRIYLSDGVGTAGGRFESVEQVLIR